MKYLIASSGADLDAKVAKRFGHAEYFIVYDSQSKSYETFPGVGHDEPAHGIGRFKDQEIEGVIIGNIGPEAFQDVTRSGWKVFLGRNMIVQDALEKVENGEILPLEGPTVKKSFHSGHQSHGEGHGHGEGEGHGTGYGHGHGQGHHH